MDCNPLKRNAGIGVKIAELRFVLEEAIRIAQLAGTEVNELRKKAALRVWR